MIAEITLPYDFTPRHYQFPGWRALEAGCLRAVWVWHRRTGKDLTAINFCATAAMERVGLYWHLFPTYNQGRKIAWQGMTKTGRPFVDHFPPEIIKNKNKTDMQVEFVNGSIYQIVGTDYINRLVGPNPVGCIFSEYSLQDPKAWELISPILLENGGWAIFVYTPRGKNHGYRLYNMAQRMSKANGSWFAQLLTITDTGVFKESQIDQIRQEGIISEEMIQQEYYCSWEAGIPGAYFSLQLVNARKEGRISGVPIHTGVPVDTWWDLGMDDSMSIVFTQDIGREVHIMDYYENSGEGFAHYAKVLREKPYIYGRHVAPHDIKVKEQGPGISRLESARRVGIKFDIAKKVKYKEDSIEMARTFFPHVWIDAVRCSRLVDCLENYRKEFDEATGTFKEHPVKDWSRHGADAFQTLAQKHEFLGMRKWYPNTTQQPGRRSIRVGAIDRVAGY
jgi:hypothetical protein